jgi:hypothetical protein
MALFRSPRGHRARGHAARRWPALAVLLVAVASACTPRAPYATEPAGTNLSTLGVTSADGRSRSYDLRHQAGVGETTVMGSPSDVWAVLPSVFQQLEIEVTRVDAADAVMGNTGYRARRIEGERVSRFLDCGRGLLRPYADEYDVTLSVTVQLLAGAEQTTRVRTIVDAYARDRSVSSGALHCLSWGSLERRVAELVAERLDG